MGQFDIDKYFKKRISNHSEDINTDDLWNDLGLEEKKKERGIFWWLFGAFACLALLTVVYHNSFSSNQNTSESTSEYLNSAYAGAVEKNENSNLANASTKSSDFIKETTNSEKDQLIKETNTSTITNAVPNFVEQDFNQINNSKINDRPTPANVEINMTDLNQIETAKIPSESNQKTSLFKSDQKTNYTEQLTRLTYLEKLKFEMLKSESQSASQIAIANNFQLISLAHKKSQLFDIGFYTHYNLAQRNITTISNGPKELDNFLTIKNSSEKVLDAIALGTNIRYKFNRGFYTQLGIEALSITERFNYQTERDASVIIEGDILSYHVSAQGDTTTMINQGTAIPTATLDWINYNHHRLLSIPLSLGYKKQNTRWSYFVEGSFHLNLLYRFSGRQLNFARDIALEALDENLKHSYVLSAGVSCKLNPRISLNLQPRFQSTFSTNSTEPDSSIPISQNYNLYGIQVGLSYSLN